MVEQNRIEVLAWHPVLIYNLQKLVKDKKILEARAFNFTYRYIDDVLSINDSRFAEFLPLIYPPELEVKETTDTASSASFLDPHILTSLKNDVKGTEKDIQKYEKMKIKDTNIFNTVGVCI